ncbi:hypothetical protein IZY60_15010 [Lutibacter sp. B2]|nr:hypothetical protein [Lutibacter sp. B2]
MFIKNKNILLHTSNEIMHFSSNFPVGLSYFTHKLKESINLYHHNILEYDIDIDNNGNIGIIILDCDGKLIYYYYDGNIWTNHLLYEVDFEVEEFHHISIKFSLNSPHIIFCWRSLSSHNLQSIISYYIENNNWEKKVLNRLHLKEDIKPYILIRDLHYNLNLIYLNNNNIIYDLMITDLSSQSCKWMNSRFVCNCIFLKFFHLDALIDSENIIHISWIDKHKENYCIKYINIDNKKNKPTTPTPILEINTPFILHQLFYQENSIICYGITDQHIYYSTKMINEMGNYSNWDTLQSTNLKPDSLNFIQIVQSTNNPFIQYNANYILSESILDVSPIIIQKIDSSREDESINYISNQRITHTVSSPIEHESTQSTDSLKKLKFELFKKNQELEMKNNLLKSLTGESSFLKQEIKQLNTQNKKYISIMHENSEKHKKHQENIINKEKDYEKILCDYELANKINNELSNKLEDYQHRLEKMKSHSNNLNSENKLLQKEIYELKNMSFFKKIFK